MIRSVGRWLSLFIIPLLIAWMIRIWFATCRKRMHGHENRSEVEKQGLPFIGTCWHFCAIGIFAFYKNESFVVMVSSSNDGDYLSRMVGVLGLSVVRGSRNKRGGQAAKELLKQLGNGNNVGLVADGSQGPARVAQPGAIFLASKTGAAILPMVWSASSYIAFNSWDRLILPRPFSRIDFFYGEPLWVPKGIKSAELEEYRINLENKMNELYENAWRIQGKEKH